MNKYTAVLKIIEPLLKKKIPMFKQSLGEFSTSKTNWLGGIMIAIGVSILLVNIENEFGIIILGNGIAAITLKDATK